MGLEFQRIQWVTVITIAAVNIFCSASVSLQAPFYPAEAERKGASATEYGLVFGSYELTSFFVSSYVGKIVEKYGLRFLLAGGMMISSTAVILFGLLDYVQHRVPFIVLSILLRVIEAIGASSAVVSGFSLIGSVFPNDVGTVFATLEIFYGAGFIIAPTLGGFLYSIGGFPFPFITLGTTGIIIAFAILLFVQFAAELPQQRKNYKLMSALKVPAIALNSVCIVMFALSAGFYSAILEPHLRQFHLTPQITSLFFIINGLTYAIVSPFLGRLLDKSMEPMTLIFLGCAFVISSFTIIGPAPFIPTNATIASCIIALVIQGVAYGAGNVATFIAAFRSARDAGLPDSIGTYGLVSGIWSSSFSLGGFIGPTIAGILYDLVGFRWATQFVSGGFVLLVLVLIIFAVVTKRRQMKYELVVSDIEESTPILANEQ